MYIQAGDLKVNRAILQNQIIFLYVQFTYEEAFGNFLACFESLFPVQLNAYNIKS